MAATFIRFYKTAISGILVLTLELNLLTVECIPICGMWSIVVKISNASEAATGELF